MNICDAKDTCLSLCFNKYNFESLDNLINKCYKRCDCNHKRININKYKNKILLSLCCPDKTFELKCKEYNFFDKKLEKFYDVNVITYK